MKKKIKVEVPIVPPEILESAKLAIHADRPVRQTKCSVCEGEVAPNSTEGLCWVCRRLKISAWRDIDQQMSAQE